MDEKSFFQISLSKKTIKFTLLATAMRENKSPDILMASAKGM